MELLRDILNQRAGLHKVWGRSPDSAFTRAFIKADWQVSRDPASQIAHMIFYSEMKVIRAFRRIDWEKVVYAVIPALVVALINRLV